MWNVLRLIKLEVIWDEVYCGDDGLYSLYNFQKTQIMAFEKKLGIVSSEQLFKNMTEEDLRTATEMFIYLNMCPKVTLMDWFQSWYSFYDVLFNTQSPNIIIIALSRMLNLSLIHI